MGPSRVAAERTRVEHEPPVTHDVGPLTAAALVRTTVTAVLFALLVAWMFAAWWSAPRAADVAQLDRAVAAGEVRFFMRADRLERSGNFWAGSVGPQTDARGGLIVWQTTSGQTWYVAPGLETIDPFGSTRPGRAEVDRIEQRLRDAGISHAYDQGVAPLLSLVLVLSALLVLVGGPAPRRGTRWFWFWAGGAPAGLGVLAWLVLERIRPPPPEISVEGQPDLRWHGFAGLAILLLGGLLASLLLPGLRDLLGSGLVPG